MHCQEGRKRRIEPRDPGGTDCAPPCAPPVGCKGNLHGLLGPNGSGKSSLAHVLSGHPGYAATAGSAALDGEDLLGLAPEDRARRGLFLAFQYPSEVPGVTMSEFLEESDRGVSAQKKNIFVARGKFLVVFCRSRSNL